MRHNPEYKTSEYRYFLVVNKLFNCGHIELAERFIKSRQRKQKLLQQNDVDNLLKCIMKIDERKCDMKLKTLKQAWKEEIKKSTKQQSEEFTAKLMLAAGSVQEGAKTK